jgi:hypothetical protein
VAVYAAAIRSAAHAPTGAEIDPKLTLLPDHSVGADQYPGGNRHGPKMSYNNWEGGFHPTAFWAIKETERM